MARAVEEFQQGVWEGGGGLGGVPRQGRGTFRRRSKRRERASHMQRGWGWGSLSGGGDSECKGPEVEMSVEGRQKTGMWDSGGRGRRTLQGLAGHCEEGTQ